MTAPLPPTPRSSRPLLRHPSWIDDDIPVIDRTESFSNVVAKLSTYIIKAIDAAYTYEQLRTTVVGQNLKPLISSLSDECHHPAVVAALLAARYRFSSGDEDDGGLSESRALACELVAWQFLTFLSEKELIDYLLYELPKGEGHGGVSAEGPSGHDRASTRQDEVAVESTALLGSRPTDYDVLRPPKRDTFSATEQAEIEVENASSPDSEEEFSESMAGMNALEIAAIGNSKKFLSQKPVQKIVTDIWNGDVIFWESLSVHAVKKARSYNKRVADPFTRLRVPKYQKAFQIAFFILFLVLYYAVLVERNPDHLTPTEILLYIWIAAFAYDEFGEFMDAGVMFYSTDFWSLWDIAIICTGAAFLVARIIGLIKHSDYITDVAFDILSMVALFLVPRIFSVTSLNSYFGSLIPVLKEMTVTFCKFLPVIIVLYLGFLTTFTMLARDRMTLNEMSWLLIKVFFGSSYLGFDMAVKISPLFGYTLMLIFVCLTNILLLTSLISLVSNSLTEVMAHAREEYLFQYSIYVLESSTSRRLTYFMPPFNLVPLLFLRPLRLVLPSEDVRRIRILVLKVTHLPFVALIWAYERSRRLVSRQRSPATTPHLLSQPFSASRSSLERDRNIVKSLPPRAALTETPRLASTELRDSTASKSASGGGVDNTDLMALVQKLSAQVDDLTAMIASQEKD